jgi:hypothetical protein
MLHEAGCQRAAAAAKRREAAAQLAKLQALLQRAAADKQALQKQLAAKQVGPPLLACGLCMHQFCFAANGHSRRHLIIMPLAAFFPLQEIITYLESKLAEQQRSRAYVAHRSGDGTAVATAGVAAPAPEPAALAPAAAAPAAAAADSSDNSASSFAAVLSAGQTQQRKPQLPVHALALEHDPEDGEEACSGGSPLAGSWQLVAEAVAPVVAAAAAAEEDEHDTEQQYLPAVDATPERQPQMLQDHDG